MKISVWSAIHFVSTFLVQFYTAYVLSWIWLWFVVPVFPGIHVINLAQAWGLMILINLFSLGVFKTLFIELRHLRTNLSDTKTEELTKKIIDVSIIPFMVTLAFVTAWILHLFV